jgi:tripartite-type tricarboxylate transporter receptor subunit TctC
MRLLRRQFLQLAAGAVALPAVSRIARAQPYPSRPVRLVVGAPAGGGFDIVARLIGQWMWERLGQPFVIENRPSAGGNIGTEAVVRAPPDGYTLLLVTGVNAISAALYEKLNFSFIRDIAPVAAIIRVPNVLVVHPSVPARTVPEFIAHAKANAGKLNKEINAGLADAKFKARLADVGGTVLPGSPADFGKFIAEDIEKWAKVIKFAGIIP